MTTGKIETLSEDYRNREGENDKRLEKETDKEELEETSEEQTDAKLKTIRVSNHYLREE